MGQEVLLQVLPLPEPPAANVLFITVVLLHVLLQRRHVTEATAALFTYERPVGGVDEDMGFQVALSAKLLSAYIADVRFLSGVQSHMQLLRQNGLEGFPTEGAGLTRFLVSLQVSQQVSCAV